MEELTEPVGSVGYRLARQRTLCGLTRPQLAVAGFIRRVGVNL